MHTEGIQCWLDETRALKRQRLDNKASGEAQLTPPSSNAMDYPPPKRFNDDDTPRAKRRNTSNSNHSLSERSSSARSGQSPLKQMSRLEDAQDGLEVRSFTVSRMPPEARRLIADVTAFSYGKGIVSVSLKDAFVEMAQANLEFEWAVQGHDIYIDESERDKDGLAAAVYTPLPETVLDTFTMAEECYEKFCPEATWNQEVHHEILTLSLRPCRQPRLGHLVNFAPSTTAAILPEWGNPTVSKKVDYCLYIEPKNDATLSDAYRDAAERMRKVMPEERLNFTDHYQFKGRFIGLSIETKKPGENVESGQLQLGVWEMARWKFLRRLAAGLGPDDDIFAAAEARRVRASQLPACLPGLVVQGHEWFLIVTTAEGPKTILWSKLLIGSTSSTRGIYQIVRTLQYLAGWVGQVLWPSIRRMLEEAD